jgi:hypothetical protein
MQIRIRIQGFDDQKWKILRLKTRFIFFTNKKLFFTRTVILRALWSTTKLQEKPPTLKREHSTHPNNTFLHFFLFLWVIFFCPQDPKKDPYSKCGSGYGSSRSKWKRIQTRYTAFCHLHWKNATFINSIEQAKKPLDTDNFFHKCRTSRRWMIFDCPSISLNVIDSANWAAHPSRFLTVHRGERR